MFGRKNKSQEISLDLQDNNIDDGHCFISGNVSIQGEVRFAGTLRIDGRVVGRVANYTGKKGHLVLSKGAVIDGPVETTSLITDGKIQGDVNIQENLECRANSIIDGEIFYGKLQIAEGAQLMGRCTQRHEGEKFGVTPTFNTATKNIKSTTKAPVENPMGFLRKPKAL